MCFNIFLSAEVFESYMAAPDNLFSQRFQKCRVLSCSLNQIYSVNSFHQIILLYSPFYLLHFSSGILPCHWLPKNLGSNLIGCLHRSFTSKLAKWIALCNSKRVFVLLVDECLYLSVDLLSDFIVSPYLILGCKDRYFVLHLFLFESVRIV